MSVIIGRISKECQWQTQISTFEWTSTCKRQFEAFCADMGMSMSTAFTIFARKAVREYRIPFEIDGIAPPNPETIKAIEEVQRMEADPSLGKTYTNADQMMKDLLRDV